MHPYSQPASQPVQCLPETRTGPERHGRQQERVQPQTSSHFVRLKTSDPMMSRERVLPERHCIVTDMPQRESRGEGAEAQAESDREGLGDRKIADRVGRRQSQSRGDQRRRKRGPRPTLHGIYPCCVLCGVEHSTLYASGTPSLPTDSSHRFVSLPPSKPTLRTLVLPCIVCPRTRASTRVPNHVSLPRTTSISQSPPP